MGLTIHWIAAVRSENKRKWGMDDTGMKMRRVIWKENSSADSTVLLEPGSPSIEKTKKKKKTKNNPCSWKAGWGRQLLPKHTRSSASSRGCSRGWALEWQSLKCNLELIFKLEFNLFFKCWFKAFGYQSHEGLKLHLHGAGLPVSFLDNFNIASGLQEPTFSYSWNHSSGEFQAAR